LRPDSGKTYNQPTQLEQQ